MDHPSSTAPSFGAQVTAASPRELATTSCTPLRSPNPRTATMKNKHIRESSSRAKNESYRFVHLLGFQTQIHRKGALTMKTKCLAVAVVLMVCMAALVVGVNADEESRGRLRASLKGFNESPANSTPASGSFRATINGQSSITFELTYSGLVADSLFAH